MEIHTDQYRELVSVQQKRKDKFFIWLRHILLMASGLLSVLIGLHQNKSQNDYERIIFAITISTLAFGILTGSILLFSEVDTLIRLQKAYAKQLIRQRDEGIQVDKLVSVPNGKFFSFLEKICYSSFIISIVSLVFYAIQLDH